MNKNNVSIIIPAYNEAALISETLTFLLADQCLTHVEIVIVCNGCVDQTADKVRLFIAEYADFLNTKAISVVIIETEKASKTNAINIGIKQSSFAFYVLLDADILINGSDILTLVEELTDRKLKAISPSIVFDFSQSSFWVRQYYQVASQSYYNVDYRLSNVIALSASGVEKIGVLPELIADDDYIRKQFLPAEIAVSKQCEYRFVCAKTFSSLFQVLTRVERGNMQLASYPHQVKQLERPQGFYRLPKKSFPFFFIIKLLVVIRAKLQLKLGKITQWERDESNRKTQE